MTPWIIIPASVAQVEAILAELVAVAKTIDAISRPQKMKGRR